MSRLLLVLPLLGLFACGSPSVPDAGARDDAGPRQVDAGPPATDAGPTVDAGSPDAGRTCVAQTDCPCFANDDCPPDMTCKSFDSTGTRVFCVPGARGTGAAGVPCTGEADCQSALCVDIRDGGMACSKLCTLPADCPTPPFSRCLYVGFGVNASLCAP